MNQTKAEVLKKVDDLLEIAPTVILGGMPLTGFKHQMEWFKGRVELRLNDDGTRKEEDGNENG